MPLRITNTTTDVSVLNRWAEEIEQRLASVKQTASSALTLVNPPSGTPSTISANFGKLTTGDNTKATMTVDSGATLSYVNNGVVNANEIGGIVVNGNTPSHVGQLLISQPGNTTAVWADPLVQGLNAPGTSGTGINPVVVGGITQSGLVQTLNTDGAGDLNVAVQNQPQVNVQDSTGEALLSTNNSLNVHLASTEILNLDGSGNLGVNIQGGTVAATLNGSPTVSVASLPLPANAAQETGGNLASVVANQVFQFQMIDLLTQILAQLKYNNLLLASSSNIQMDDFDQYTSTVIQ